MIFCLLKEGIINIWTSSHHSDKTTDLNLRLPLVTACLVTLNMLYTGGGGVVCYNIYTIHTPGVLGPDAGVLDRAPPNTQYATLEATISTFLALNH